MADIASILNALFGIGGAQAAEPPNPFGKILPFPGTRSGRGSVPGESMGGGSIIPPQPSRPPNRFEEIMKRADSTQRSSYRDRTGGEVLNPPEVQRAIEGKPDTARTRNRRTGEVTREFEISPAERKMLESGAKEPPGYVAERNRLMELAERGYITPEQLRTRIREARTAHGLPLRDTAKKGQGDKREQSIEMLPGESPAAFVERGAQASKPGGGFVERRAAQLQREQQAKEAAQQQELEAATSAARARMQARQGLAEEWIASRGKPKRVTPDLIRERNAERRLGAEMTAPQVSTRGFVVEGIKGKGVQIVTNPGTGAARARVYSGEQQWVNVPFRTRVEALEWAATPRTAAEARAKAELQEQRLRNQQHLFAE